MKRKVSNYGKKFLKDSESWNSVQGKKEDIIHHRYVITELIKELERLELSEVQWNCDLKIYRRLNEHRGELAATLALTETENEKLKEKIYNYEETLEKIKAVGGNLFFHNEKLKFQVAKLAKELKKKVKS